MTPLLIVLNYRGGLGENTPSACNARIDSAQIADLLRNYACPLHILLRDHQIALCLPGNNALAIERRG